MITGYQTKLNLYRDSKAKSQDWADGFDHAMKLDLAVKFHLWTQKNQDDFHMADPDRWIIHPKYVDLEKEITTYQLYNFWVTKIYKPKKP